LRQRGLLDGVAAHRLAVEARGKNAADGRDTRRGRLVRAAVLGAALRQQYEHGSRLCSADGRRRVVSRRMHAAPYRVAPLAPTSTARQAGAPRTANPAMCGWTAWHSFGVFRSHRCWNARLKRLEALGILGLSEEPPLPQVGRGLRELARREHPDLFAGVSEAGRLAASTGSLGAAAYHALVR